MNPDMTWLIGLRIKEAEKMDYTWFFRMAEGSVIATESPWRLLDQARIAVTSTDDGQWFGLPAPVDAAERIKQNVGDAAIARLELRDRSGDLVLHFSNGISLEFLNDSCGYEGWRTTHGSQEVVCVDGGRLVELGQQTDGDKANS